MFVYIFDASGLVSYLTNRPSRTRQILDYLIEQRKVHHQATLFVPNFCVAEVFNALAKFRFDLTVEAEKRLNEAQYRDCLKRFRKLIHWGEVFYPYDLNRYHILAADDIIPAEQQLPRRPKRNSPAIYDRLSTLDILVIAMGMELAYLFEEENVTLITGDERMKFVADDLKNTRREQRASSRVTREDLGSPDPRRWPLPRVFDLHTDYPSELPCVDKQRPLRLPQA